MRPHSQSYYNPMAIQNIHDIVAHYNVDKDQLSVSGFSSGGFFAVQFHVAFSETIMGAGIVAGGNC